MDKIRQKELKNEQNFEKLLNAEQECTKILLVQHLGSIVQLYKYCMHGKEQNRTYRSTASIGFLQLLHDVIVSIHIPAFSKF